MVEGTSLLRKHTGITCIEGSNPSLSAIIKDKKVAEIPLLITSAIEPNPNQKSLVMVQKEERLIATKASIFLWASLGQKKLLYETLQIIKF